MEPIIRARTEADIEKLAAILVQVYATDGYPVEGVAEPRAWLEVTKPLGTWVATLDDAIVGHIALTEPGPGDEAAKLLGKNEGRPASEIAVVGRLFVAPAGRGHGLGGRLLDAALEKAHQEQRVCVLDVMDKDKAAIRTYQNRGWHQIGLSYHRTQGKHIPAICFREPHTNTSAKLRIDHY